MQTTMTSSKLTSTTNGDLINAAVTTLAAIDAKYSTNPKYLVKGTTTGQVSELVGKLAVGITGLGVRDRKRLKRYLNSYIGHPTLFSVNRVLRFLSHQCERVTAIKITEPKHEAIQAHRQAWLKLQAEADMAYSVYKEEKSTYYKNN